MNPFEDPSLAVDDRVGDLIGRLSLKEKVKQLGCVWSTELVEDDVFDNVKARSVLVDGIGHVTRIGASTGLRPRDNAHFMNQIQRVLVEHSRLGIPAIVHEEAVSGFCARGATQFPQAIGLASTFDPELIASMADVIRQQMLAVGARHALAPVMDIARDPRWGRLEETYGEDPYLAGRMSVAYVRGLQGADLTRGVVATGKHFLGYGLPEGGMNHAPVHLGPRQLREIFAEPFAAAIRDADLLSVMNSYSSIDGLPCGGSKEILDDLLRGELGFDGVVVADYFTTSLLIRHHRVARDQAEAAAMALRAGMDVELPALECFACLEALVETGQLDVALVDRAVGRLLAIKFRLGLFESPYVDEERVAEVFETTDQRALARRLAAQSVVLLENDGILPLTMDQRVALLGPAADDIRLLQGDYSYPAHTEIVYRRDELRTHLAPAKGGRFQPGPYFVDMITPVAAMAERNVGVVHARGCTVDASDDDIDAAVAAARDADVAVICLGGRSGLLPDCTSGEFRDASHLELTGDQERLVEKVSLTGTPIVSVVIGGRAFALSKIAEHSSALVEAWLPGEEGGRAIVDVLYGDVNPGGRLPVSLPRHAGQVPVYYNHKSGGGRSAFLGDYTDSPTRPLFAFGHGLSYSEFEYADLDCLDAVDSHGLLAVAVTVTNTSAIDGDEVVQLYVHDKVASVARPVKQLAGFARVPIEAGGSRRVTFEMDLTQLAFFDREMNFVVEPGDIDVMIGASSADIRAEKTVAVTGDQRLTTQRQIVATQVHVQ